MRKMNSLFAVLLSCFIFVCIEAHVCLIFPPQRGGIPDAVFTYAGDITCLHVLKAPCGGMAAEDPKVSFKAGQNGSLSIQKNLDHYYASNPGYWGVYLWTGGAKRGKYVGGFPDTADFKTFDTRSVDAMIPADTPTGNAFIQVIYAPNNPDTPKMFYQCADIKIE
ncbi:PREDICTED: uncharacterized protein LOC105313217 [Amphimedon queenslandica]|uniref:Copper acquisition factor BIM1-like domain-containing protein n=1 Tax=Amphimedon queenslandica TaxID=400682 RepID=A0A1X7ULP8_AMPQE|nr:PREDICTED: uncharacterized protein LOC105313217 [Amphimedon queenslandica]|eukprot:XP_011404756.1 PREDICTED: uncharacterized protein LOC105313217 [Amphimedon queenslandica]